jgi:peptidyl-prolyl cis-trans isomerase SurA
MKQYIYATVFLSAFATAPALAQSAAPVTASVPDVSIAAVVNGQVITNQDVADRAKLLAVSTGMQLTPDALARLSPQITTQLINQTLQLQEINRRKVVVQENDIGAAIDRIEQGNNLPPGGLRQKLEASGVPYSTLIAQIRTELGWQDVLHQVLGPELQPTAGDLNAEKKALKAEIGSTQYHIAEIFIPVTDPADETTAKDFATTVITQLHAGAPFPILAAQFSQSQTALQGGDLGFVALDRLDPAVAAIVQQMPVGAISNPVRVPGGYDIVQLEGVHQIGTEMQTMMTLRQAFARYPQPITNGQVGPAQIGVIEKLVAAGKTAHACSDMEAINASYGNIRPADPGPVNLATVSPPQFQSILAGLSVGQVTQPLIAQDGVSIIMLCDKKVAAAALPSDDDIKQVIVQRRVELESQQLQDDLRHQSIITQN